MVIVTGGDDQAVCVAKVELFDPSAKPSDEASQPGEEQGGRIRGLKARIPAGNRCAINFPSVQVWRNVDRTTAAIHPPGRMAVRLAKP